MDGNGRWANRRFMPRFVGHKQGVDALVRTVKACADRGIGTRSRSPCDDGLRPRSDSRIAFSIFCPMPFSQGCTLIVRASSRVTLATWLSGTMEP